MTDIIEQMCGSPLWSMTLPYTEPDFTFCFQYSLMIWVPCFFLWFMAPCWIYMIKRKRNFVSKKSWLTFSKLVSIFYLDINFLTFPYLKLVLLYSKIFIILLIAIEVANLVFSAIREINYSDVKPILFCTPLILIATYVIIISQ